MRIWLRRLFIFIACCLVGAYGILKFAVPIAVSTQYVKTKIEAGLSASLGRSIKLTPDLHISWGLWPDLIISEISIGNPASITDSRPFVTLKKVHLKLNSWPLVSGKVALPLVAFESAEIHLVREKNGANNWTFPASNPPASSSGAEKQRSSIWLPEIKRIELDAIHLAYSDAQTGQEHKCSLEGCAINGFAGTGPISIESRVALDERKFSLNASGTDLSGLLSGNRFPLKLSIEHAGQKLDLDGTISLGGATPFSIQTKTKLSGSGLDKLLRSYGIDPIPEMSKDALSGVVSYENRELALNIERATVDAVALSGSAKLSFKDPKPQGRVRIKVSGSNLEAILKGFGLTNPPAIDQFDINAEANLEEKSDQIKIEDANFDTANIKGEVRRVSSESVPVLTGNVEAKNIDLTRILPHTEEKAAAPAAQSNEKEKYVFSEKPFDLSKLGTVQANFDLDLANIVPSDRISIDTLKAKVAIENGELKVENLDSNMIGGTLKGDFNLGEKGVFLNLTAANLAFEKISASKGVQGGKMDLKVHLEGAGASPHAIASSLKGTYEHRLSNVTLTGGGLFFSTSNLFDVLSPLSREKKGVLLDCVVARFKVAQGVADAQGLAAKIGDVSILGDGDVDFKKEQMSLGFVPQSSSIGAATLIPPLKVFGPFKSFSILPNPLRLATEQLDNLQGLLGGTFGAVENVAGTFGSFAGISDREKKIKPTATQSCDELIEANADKLTTLVGGMVFGDQPGLIDRVKARGGQQQ